MVPRECATRATVVADPALSSTVQLHGDHGASRAQHHHPHTHVTKYLLTQHYFTVPLQTQDTTTDPKRRDHDANVAEEDEDTHEAPPRQRPLLAVDFGHAVRLEHVRAADDDEDDEPYERGQEATSFCLVFRREA
ncbi:hypothetical protein V8E52_000893 [Russula decolorans]